jgi:hypothetical protein
VRTLLFACVLVGAVPAAPLPAPAKRPPAEGVWLMEWGSGEGWCELRPGGGLLCLWGHHRQRWHGTWKLEGDTLTVDEWRTPDAANEWAEAGPPFRWVAVLEPGKLSGRLSGGGRFALKKK